VLGGVDDLQGGSGVAREQLGQFGALLLRRDRGEFACRRFRAAPGVGEPPDVTARMDEVAEEAPLAEVEVGRAGFAVQGEAGRESSGVEQAEIPGVGCVRIEDGPGA